MCDCAKELEAKHSTENEDLFLSKIENRILIAGKLISKDSFGKINFSNDVV